MESGQFTVFLNTTFFQDKTNLLSENPGKGDEESKS